MSLRSAHRGRARIRVSSLRPDRVPATTTGVGRSGSWSNPRASSGARALVRECSAERGPVCSNPPAPCYRVAGGSSFLPRSGDRSSAHPRPRRHRRRGRACAREARRRSRGTRWVEGGDWSDTSGPVPSRHLRPGSDSQQRLRHHGLRAYRQTSNRLSTATQKKASPMTQSKFLPGWDEARVRSLLAHYESQTDEEAVAEDEAAVEGGTDTVMTVPKPLVPAVRELIAKHQRGAGGSRQ